MANSFNNSYYTSYPTNSNLEIKSYWWLLYPDEFTTREWKIVLNYPDGSQIEKKDEGSASNRFWSFTATLTQSGIYKIQYFRSTADSDVPTELFVSYSFVAIENKLPLKQWTVTAVINRLLDLAEPLRKGERPRFLFNGTRPDGTIITEENREFYEEVGQAAKFDKVLAPQFAFTKQTLRECLQDVGSFIHGEARITVKKFGHRKHPRRVLFSYPKTK